MENILFENEVCKELKLPSIPKREWDGETPFDKGVGIVKMAFDEKAYAIVRFDVEKEQKPNVVKVFSTAPFYEIEKVFVVPSYMETDVEDADLDEESKKKAEELANQATEIENEDNDNKIVDNQKNPYFFDHIHNDDEAIAFIESYNKENKIGGRVPKAHETILMRLSVIYADLKKASGFEDNK